MQNTLQKSDKQLTQYKIWGLEPWLIDARLLDYKSAFINLRFDDLMKLQRDYFLKKNLWGRIINEIMVMIELARLKQDYLEYLKKMVQNPGDKGYNVRETLESLHTYILNFRNDALIGPLSQQLVELLVLIYKDIPKVKKRSDRFQCWWTIYALSLLGSRNNTFKAKEKNTLNKWINHHKKKYFTPKPDRRH